MVDRVVEHFEHGARGPVTRSASETELRAALGGPVPQLPGDPIEAMQALVDVALVNMQHGDHPRYFARVPSPSSYAGVLGEWLGTGFNAIATSWAGSSGPSTVELVVLDWLGELLGLPAETEGVLLSGGSLSNLTALAAAREAVGPGVAYLSDQTHASIRRALVTLGFPAAAVRVLDSGERMRLTAAAVADAVHEDRSRGLCPRFIVATAGTTNTAEQLRAAVGRGLALAQYAQQRLEADPAWRVITPAQLGIVTFTRSGWSAEEHPARVAALTADGYATLTSTRLRGRPALRLCTINPRTRESDIADTLERLAAGERPDRITPCGRAAGARAPSRRPDRG